ncbi:MAG: DNA polymerase III subunit delta [Bacteroidales bacterium]|jgi:DNA polymerase-3 subunit delta|nr:DNA polymerase III subunit delta [Bacteroidales bacterium]
MAKKKQGTITYDALGKALKSRQYKPVYLFMGDEAYFIDVVTKYIMSSVLKPEEQGFNQHVLYGKDTDVNNLILTAKQFPMMSAHQLIILKEAQDMKKIEELVAYTDNPLESTILVINYKYGSLPANRKLYKSIAKCGEIFISNSLYENEIPAWATRTLRSKKISIDNNAALLLAEFLGNDLSKISNELDKLAMLMPKGENHITPTHVEKNIGISKDYNNFELQKALGTKDVAKAFRIVNHFKANPKNNPLTVTLGVLYNYYMKIFNLHMLKGKSQSEQEATLRIPSFFMNEYKLAARNYSPGKIVNIIADLREYDLKSKGVNNVSSSDGDLLLELVYKIIK